MVDQTDLGHWENCTGLELTQEVLDECLGFVYEIQFKEYKYIGRKQFWIKRGKNWYDSGWRGYCSSSNEVRDWRKKPNVKYRLLAVFTTKSALRYAETSAIVRAGTYCCNNYGVNFRIEQCRGRVAMTELDTIQMKHLEKYFENTPSNS